MEIGDLESGKLIQMLERVLRTIWKRVSSGLTEPISAVGPCRSDDDEVDAIYQMSCCSYRCFGSEMCNGRWESRTKFPHEV